MQTRIEPGTVQPAKIQDSTFARASRLDPPESFGTPAAVISREQKVPNTERRDGANNVDDKKATHGVFAFVVSLMPMVRPRLRARQGAMDSPSDFFRGLAPRPLWKKAINVAPEAIAVLFQQVCSMSTRYNVAGAAMIRDFKPDDFDTLWRMDQECFPRGIAYSKPELKFYIRYRGSFTLVAVDVTQVQPTQVNPVQEKIQGFIVAHGGPTGHIVTIDVSPANRRTGVGSQLLQNAEDRLRASGSHSVSLEAAVDNLKALSFYKRHGYSVIRTWPRYYSNGVDALVLEKEL
jgi:ribosomal-protein-alanine N-acetyltransferase